jgi:hypothetical protein
MMAKLLPLSVRRWIAAVVFTIYTSNAWWASLLLEEAGTAGDVKIAYAASSAITVTNLQSIASSATWVAGWESGAIDNSSNLYLDYIINAAIVAASSGLTAGEIRMYLVAELDDSSWPDVFDGTESTETISDTQTRDAICRLAAMTVTDTTNSQTWYLMCPSVAQVFGGTVPRKFVVFITQSTGQNLAAAGNAVYIKGVYQNVAP